MSPKGRRHELLRADADNKAKLYAAAGVQDYRLINTDTLTTTVFRDPADTGYQSRHVAAPDAPLNPL